MSSDLLLESAALLEGMLKRPPYIYKIPRLCFHQTELFPDIGDPIDTNRAILQQQEAVEQTDVHGSTSSPQSASNPNTANKGNSSVMQQPKFRVVISGRVWDFLSTVQFVGYSDTPRQQQGHEVPVLMRSRHVLLTGGRGTGKSTLVMTGAAFLTYRVITNIYRIATIGDARAWANSGDPFMYFALEMLVALRQYYNDNVSRSRSNSSYGDAGDDHENSTEEEEEDGFIDEDELEEIAGFLVEPRALTSVNDVRTWLMAIRQKLIQEAIDGGFLSTGDSDIPDSTKHTSGLSSMLARPKLVIIVDQAEYLLEHPDCIPAQIVSMLLQMEAEGVSKEGCVGISHGDLIGTAFLPSLVLSIRAAHVTDNGFVQESPTVLPSFPQSPLKVLINELVKDGTCLSYHLPTRVDGHVAELVSRLAIRRSLPLFKSFRRRRLGVWESDMLAMGEVQTWTGYVLGDLVKLFTPIGETSLPPPIVYSFEFEFEGATGVKGPDKSLNTPTNGGMGGTVLGYLGNRILHLIVDFQRIVQGRVQKELGILQSVSQNQHLLTLITHMALHLPLLDFTPWFGIDARLRELLFLPMRSYGNSTLQQQTSQTLASLPTVQSLWHPRHGTIRLEHVPTAINLATFLALINPRLVGTLAKKTSKTKAETVTFSFFTTGHILDEKLNSLFPTHNSMTLCPEGRRRTLVNLVRTALLSSYCQPSDESSISTTFLGIGPILCDNTDTLVTLDLVSLLGDQVTLTVALNKTRVVPFTGNIASPAIIASFLREDSPGNCIFLPLRTDFPFFDILILMDKGCLYGIISSPDTWARLVPETHVNGNASGQGSANQTFPEFKTNNPGRLFELAFDNSDSTTLMGNSVADGFSRHFLSPMHLMEAWQDSIQETILNLDTEAATLDTVVNAYESIFSSSAPTNKPNSFENNNGCTPMAPVICKKTITNSNLKKLKRPSVNIKIVYINNAAKLASSFGFLKEQTLFS